MIYAPNIWSCCVMFHIFTGNSWVNSHVNWENSLDVGRNKAHRWTTARSYRHCHVLSPLMDGFWNEPLKQTTTMEIRYNISSNSQIGSWYIFQLWWSPFYGIICCSNDLIFGGIIITWTGVDRLSRNVNGSSSFLLGVQLQIRFTWGWLYISSWYFI